MQVKATRFDMFSPQSGERVGNFSLEARIPWRQDEFLIEDEVDVKKKNVILKRHVPVGLKAGIEDRTLTYTESVRFEHEDKASITTTAFETVWQCPGPDLGNVIIVCNFRVRNSDRWQQLRYSMRESPVR